MPCVITIRDLHKRFKLYRRPEDRLMESLLRRPRHHTHHALTGVSFTVQPRETLGIIGRNGAGKSTLLKILMGVLLPDAGECRVVGKVTGLLELGTGFDPRLSGRANILRNGVLIGMSHTEIAARTEAIIAFSELGDYINEPLRTYSSGMTMRLAFAIAIHADPRCFLVDEALSVGDAHFQQKCLRKIQEFRRDGGSLIFVSHDLNSVKVLCDRAIVLEAGRVELDDTPEAAVNHYNRLIARLDDNAQPTVTSALATQCYGTGAVEVSACELLGADSQAGTLSAGELAVLRVAITGHADITDLTMGLLIRDRFGRDIFGTNTCFMQQALRIADGQRLQLELRFIMNLAPGKYTLTTALHSGTNHLEQCYQWCDNLLRFEVAGVRGPLFYGVARLEPELSVQGLEP
jgi:lipopolysaccharide transport system ATP-binding protein